MEDKLIVLSIGPIQAEWLMSALEDAIDESFRSEALLHDHSSKATQYGTICCAASILQQLHMALDPGEQSRKGGTAKWTRH